MGWQEIIDKDNKRVGVVDDAAWDIAGVALDKLRETLNKLYQKNFGKDINNIEFEQVVNFTMPTWDEDKRVREKIEEIVDFKVK